MSDSPGFGDYVVALEYRRAMEGIVKEVLEVDRPNYRYAKVITVDYVKSKCEVLYPGEVGSNVVNLNTVRPIVPGQWVRVEGAVGDKYVSDVQDGRSQQQGQFLFSEPLKDPDVAQEVLMAMDNGVLEVTGQSSGLTLMTVNEATGVVNIPGLVLPAPDTAGKVVAEVYSSNIGTVRVQNTETVVSPITFTADPDRKYSYYAQSLWVGSIAGGTFFVRTKYASGSSVVPTSNTIDIDQWQNINTFGNKVIVRTPLPRGISGQYTVGTSLAAINTGQGVMDRSTSVAQPYWVQIIDEG